jgi:hypothetical protein
MRQAWWAALAGALLAGGCARGPGGNRSGAAAPTSDADRAPPAATQPTTMPAPLAAPPMTYEDRARGVRLEYPGDWHCARSEDYVLRVLPPGAQPDEGGVEMTLDVPSLPPHVPGFIPLGMVEKGYVDDLRQNSSSFKALERSDSAVPGARARLVRSTWTATAGEERAEDALLMVHGDRVYILRLTGPAAAVEAQRPVFDETARSVRWLK